MTRLPPGDVRPATWVTSLVELTIMLVLSTAVAGIAAEYAIATVRPHGSPPRPEAAVACNGTCPPAVTWVASGTALPSRIAATAPRPFDVPFQPRGMSDRRRVAIASMLVPVARTPLANEARPERQSAPTTRRTHHVLSGVATWHATGRDGAYAAAGPLLREALGRGWRGTQVRVCSGGRCIRVTLNDVCWCPKGRRLIDLSDEAFARLASLSRGVIVIEIRR